MEFLGTWGHRDQTRCLMEGFKDRTLFSRVRWWTDFNVPGKTFLFQISALDNDSYKSARKIHTVGCLLKNKNKKLKKKVILSQYGLL